MASTIQALMLEVENLKKKVEEKVSRNDEKMDEDDDEDDGDQVTSWQQVLPNNKVPPSLPSSCMLCSLLHDPPPLEMVRTLETGGARYQQIPDTPAPRRFGPDRQWYNVQMKLENAMHAMVHTVETQEPENIKYTAALIRSAWEDCQQNRRALLAGKERAKLDKRVDDNRPRLLSKEEESKMSRGREQFQPRKLFPQAPWPKFRSNSQQREQGKGKGTGKGKGKGRFQK